MYSSTVPSSHGPSQARTDFPIAEYEDAFLSAVRARRVRAGRGKAPDPWVPGLPVVRVDQCTVRLPPATFPAVVSVSGWSRVVASGPVSQ